MKISLCIEPVFSDQPVEARVQLAKDCGVDAIEFWDAGFKAGPAIAKACERAGMPIACMSVKDSWAIRLSDAPQKVLGAMEETVKAGKDLGCSMFIGLSGEQTGRVQAQKSLLIANLSRVAELMEKHGCVALIEPLNSLYDHKGYYLDSASEGFEIVRAVGSPGVKLLYDIYHMQLMEGNLVNSITTHADAIGHFHCAGVPGRHEPQNGEIHYPAVVRAIEGMGYAGHFGLEYWPTYEDAQSVADTVAYLRAAR